MPLKDDPLIKEFTRRVNEAVKKETESVAMGDCTNFESYRQKVGVIKGLNKALELMSETITKYTDDDEFD